MANPAGSGSNYFDTAIFNGLIPREGPKALAVSLPFTIFQGSFSIDLTLTGQQQFFSAAQGVYVDNSLNLAQLTISVQGTNQSLSIPAGAQGYFPLLASKPNVFVISTNPANVNCSVIFLNVPVPSVLWFPAGTATGGGGGGGSTPATTLVTSQVNVGTTAVQLFAGSAFGAIVKNTSAQTIFVGPVGVTAANGFPLTQGDVFNGAGYSGPLFGITAGGTALAGVGVFS